MKEWLKKRNMAHSGTKKEKLNRINNMLATTISQPPGRSYLYYLHITFFIIYTYTYTRSQCVSPV